MSTTPPPPAKEKAGGALTHHGSGLPLDKKIVADSIGDGSDTDDSHQYVTGDVFAQGGQQQFYEPIAEYEGRHRYDPAAQWTEAEEKRLVRRVRTDSSWVLVLACLLPWLDWLVLYLAVRVLSILNLESLSFMVIALVVETGGGG
jgi:hypothetical protein